MHLQEVKDKKTEDLFFEVPSLVYRNVPNYIPHIRQDLEKIFDPESNRLFQKGGKAKRWVLLDERDVAVGRVAAFVHPVTSKAGKYPVGGMGFFECINDKDAAFQLFNACKDWLSDQGMLGMDGPINFGERDQFWGLVVENFDSPGSYAMNFNPPYYRSLFEEYGFQNYFNQLVFWRDLSVPAQEIFVKKNQSIKRDSRFKVRNMRGVPTEQIAEYFLEVYNSAWGGHAGFKQMQPKHALNLFKSMAAIMDREILIFAFHDDKPVGFYLNIPELNDSFRYVNGNLNWWGKIKFILHLKFGKKNTMVGIVFGVAREWQGKGVEGAMIKFAEETIAQKGRYKQTILAWIGDFNPKMLKVVDNLGASLYRKLTTYRIWFDESIPFERHPIICQEKVESQQEQ